MPARLQQQYATYNAIDAAFRTGLPRFFSQHHSLGMRQSRHFTSPALASLTHAVISFSDKPISAQTELHNDAGYFIPPYAKSHVAQRPIRLAYP